MTNDEDRKAFEYKAGRGGYYLDRDPSNAERYAYASTQAAWAMWRYARDHYRHQVQELDELRSIVKSYEAFGGVNLLTAMAEMRRDVRELVEAVDKACKLYFTDLDEVECEDVVIDEREQAIDDLMALWRDKLADKLKEQHDND